MCFKFAKTSMLALVAALWLELPIRSGICDDSQLTSSSYPQAGVKGSNETLSTQHVHHNWKGWEDWLPSEQKQSKKHKETLERDEAQHFIPLSLSEQAKLRYRRNRTEKKFSGKQQQNGQSKSSKNATDKTEKKILQNEGDSIIDLKNLRDTAKSLAASLMNHFISSWATFPSNFEKSVVSESSVPRNSRAVYLDNLGERQDGPNYGKPERDSKRGVIDWLSRLIGVQGKTLGEFLREYQVHVLYDLAFTFFKWIFFLYAGLLIP